MSEYCLNGRAPSLSGVSALDELERWMTTMGLNKSDLCIVGSAVMAAYVIRENGDLEIAVKPRILKELIRCGKLRKIPYVFGHVNVARGVDLFKNFGFPMGLNDKCLFKNIDFVLIDGWQFISLQMELEYKYFLAEYLGRKKDFDDICEIEKLVGKTIKKRKFGYRIARIRFSYWFWNHCKKLKELIKNERLEGYHK